MARYRRVPSFLFRALGLEDPTLPMSLDTSNVIPTLDVLQKGLRDSELVVTSTTIPAATGPATYDIITNTAEVSAALLYLTVIRTGGAAHLLRYLLVQVNGTFNIHVDHQADGTTVAGFLLWRDFLRAVPGQPGLYIPANFIFRVQDPAGTAVGETLEIRTIHAIVPAGVAPW